MNYRGMTYSVLRAKYTIEFTLFPVDALIGLLVQTHNPHFLIVSAGIGIFDVFFTWRYHDSTK